MPRRKLIILLLFLSLLLLPLTLPAGERATVLKVTDGDTLWLRVKGRRIKIRLLGIDTPEKYHSRKMERDCISCGVSEYFMKHLGKEASKHMKELAGKGSAVLLKNTEGDIRKGPGDNLPSRWDKRERENGRGRFCLCV